MRLYYIQYYFIYLCRLQRHLDGEWLCILVAYLSINFSLFVILYYSHCSVTSTGFNGDVNKDEYRLWVKNFGTYCPILIILSLLQTEINYDQVYPQIYHRTSNLLVHYLVKWTWMYWPTLLAWFRKFKDVTVKQVILNVTDGQNQQLSVQKLYSKCTHLARTHAGSLPCHWSIASSKIDCSRPHRTSMSWRLNSSILWICPW